MEFGETEHCLKIPLANIIYKESFWTINQILWSQFVFNNDYGCVTRAQVKDDE